MKRFFTTFLATAVILCTTLYVTGSKASGEPSSEGTAGEVEETGSTLTPTATFQAAGQTSVSQPVTETAARNAGTSHPTTPAESKSTKSPANAVTMTIAEKNITTHSKSMTLDFQYSGDDKEALFGFDLTVEFDQSVDGKWVPVPIRGTDITVPAKGGLLTYEYPSNSFAVDLTNYVLEAGHYRIVKTVSPYTLVSEFDIAA